MGALDGVRVLAIIPARGGSKGLPRKNVHLLSGLPLIAHSILCAQMAATVSRVVVSTDDAEIAEIALRHGAEVPSMRPRELATDEAPLFPVIAHTLNEVEAEEGSVYDYVILLDPTSPCRLPSDIEKAVVMLDENTKSDGVIACSKPFFNPLWVCVTEEDGYVKPAFPAYSTSARRQDLPTMYRINGSLYLWRAAFVRRRPTDWRAFPHLLLETPENRAFSVDSQEEFDLLEAVVESGVIKLPWLNTAI
jgi:N-acylneuraminate cytidylyltransferase